MTARVVLSRTNSTDDPGAGRRDDATPAKPTAKRKSAPEAVEA